MALVLKDRVKETSTTTGTGTLTLGGAVTDYQAFSSAIGNGNTTYYAIDSGTEWEVGIGTVGAGTLSRDTVLSSSNSGSLVNFGAGQKTVWCDYPAGKAIYTDANGNISNLAGSISSAKFVQFDTSYATALTAGQLGWDGNDTLAIGMAGGNVTQHIGEDLYFYCKATSAITKGQVVMFTGAVGASGVPTGAPATGITDGTYIMGIAAESIALNGFGLIQSFGELKNVNTSGYADGDILWYDPSVTGGLTKTKPSAPNVKVQMAAVINGGSSGGGTILIRIDAGSTLGGTDSNAQITSPSNGQILTYDGTNTYWKNTTLTAGTGITTTPSSTGVITVTNTAPDQTVVLTAGTGISTSGTYPNFTITNTSPSLGGDVVGPASATDNAISRYDGTTGKLIQNSAAYIDDSGNVGVGTASPPLKLSLLSGNATNNNSVPLVSFSSDRTDRYSSIDCVRGSVSGLIGLGFSVSNNAAPAEAMRIDSSGNVGIGATPTYKLDVSGSGTQTVRSVTTDTSGTSVARFRATYTGGGGGTASSIDLRAGDSYTYLLTESNVPMLFGTNNTERMRITSAGGVSFGSSGTAYGTSGQVLQSNGNAPPSWTTLSSMVYPSAGIAVSTGSAWGTSLTAPSGTIVGTTDTQTLTNKRITPRVSTTTSSATPTINTDNVDVYGLTAQAADITSFTTNLSGTPTDGQKLQIYIVGTAARAITWGASFEASTQPLPTTTVSTNRLDVGFIWNAATSKWRCVAVA